MRLISPRYHIAEDGAILEVVWTGGELLPNYLTGSSLDSKLADPQLSKCSISNHRPKRARHNPRSTRGAINGRLALMAKRAAKA